MTPHTDPRVLRWYRMAERIPVVGPRIFTELFKFAAPYFRTIPVAIESVRPGEVRVAMRDRRSIRNHIGTIHAIALCNLAELAMGVAAEVTLPTSHRWLPKSMHTEYLAKAQGPVMATATLDLPALGDKQELVVPISVTDRAGKEVFRARITIWVTEKPAA